MPNRPTSGFPAIYQEVPSENRLSMRWIFNLKKYDITHLHFHTCIEIGICVSGSGICCIDGEEYPFHAGDIQIIFPYMNHMHRSDPPTPAQWYWLFTDYTELATALNFRNTVNVEQEILTRVATFGTISEADFPKTLASLRRMFEEAIRDVGNEFADQKTALNIYLSFIYLLEESKSRPPISVPDSHKDIIKITPALSEIARRIEDREHISVAEMAAKCNYSVTNFRRIFTRYFHCSPQQYIALCRIRMAKHLLTDDNHHSIIDIAHMVGFDNISGFNRAFKSITGMTPSDFRHQVGH